MVRLSGGRGPVLKSGHSAFGMQNYTCETKFLLSMLPHCILIHRDVCIGSRAICAWWEIVYLHLELSTVRHTCEAY